MENVKLKSILLHIENGLVLQVVSWENIFRLCSENIPICQKIAFIFRNLLSGRLISLEDAVLLSCLFVSHPILGFHAQQATTGFHHC